MIEKPAGYRTMSSSSALACLFSALICAGAYISIPIGPIPLTLGNFFAILGGLLLGPLWGGLSASLYIAIGALGFPVFSGGRGGLAHIAGPTGGYLAGYVVGAVLAGFLARRRGRISTIAGSALGFFAILAIGSMGFAAIGGLPLPKAMALGVLPFLPGDCLKAALAAFIAIRMGAFADSLRGKGGRKRDA